MTKAVEFIGIRKKSTAMKIAEYPLALLLLATMVAVAIPFAVAFGIYLLATGLLFVTMLPLKLLIAALEG